MASRKRMASVDWFAWVFTVLGAINWGLVGVSKLNIVDEILGTSPSIVQVVYIIIGLSGLYQLWIMLGNR